VIRSNGEAEMRPTKILTIAGLTVAMALAGCANDPNLSLVTSSVAKPKPVKVAVDPTCTALTTMINSVRQEGTPARVRAVATSNSKTRMVNIKRASLAKIAELDKLNAEYQMKCGKYPSLRTASTQAIAAQSATATALPKKAQAIKKPAKSANNPIVTVPKQ